MCKFLDWLNGSGETHPKYWCNDSMGWGLGQNKKEAEHQHLSVSLHSLWTQCDQLPHAFPIRVNIYPQTDSQNKPFLKLL